MPSAQDWKDKSLVLLNKCQTISRMSSALVPTSSAGVPGSFLSGFLITCYSRSIISPWEAERHWSGRGSTEGRGGQDWDHRRGEGMVSEPSTWLQGKGCFVIFGSNFQRQNRKCPLKLGSQERYPLVCLERGTFPSTRVPECPSARNCGPVWNLRLRLNPGAFSPYSFLQHFFFFLNETSASFLTCWKNFPLPKLGSGTLSLWKNFSCYTVQCFFSFFLLIELFVLSTFVLGTFLMGYFPL